MSIAPFMGSFFIILREGFEAMLIAMLIFTYLEKLNAQDKKKYVWQGIGYGVLASIVIAIGFTFITSLTHAHEELFEGVTMLIAAGVLAYVAFWCHTAKQHVEGTIKTAITTGTAITLSLAVFFAILREGFEIVLFYAGLFASPIAETYSIWFGGVAGAVALGVVYILMKKGIAQINVGTFFTISKWLLGALAVYFAYNGVHELLELMEGSH
jgi:high-affinity iron transporter